MKRGTITIEKITKAPECMICDAPTGKMTDVHSISTAACIGSVCAHRHAAALARIRNHSAEAAALLDRYLLPSKVKGHITKHTLLKGLEKIGCPVEICAFCFAIADQSMYKGLRNKLSCNLTYLSTLRAPEELPVIDREIFRIESEGDVQSTIQARNYIRIAKKNPGTTFAAWTKNPEYWKKALLAEGGKPENMILILSSPVINQPDYATLARYNQQYNGMFDKLFTVYSRSYAKENYVPVNCCDKNSPDHGHCAQCRKCYTHNNIHDIKEIIHG